MTAATVLSSHIQVLSFSCPYLTPNIHRHGEAQWAPSTSVSHEENSQDLAEGPIYSDPLLEWKDFTPNQQRKTKHAANSGGN